MRPRDPASDPSDDPLVEEVPTHGPVAFEPRPVGGGRGTGRSIAVWAAIVAIAVGVGVLGQHVALGPDGAAVVAVPASSPSPTPTDEPGATEVAVAAPPIEGTDPIILSSPLFGPAVVTSARLEVEGSINVRAIAADVSLEARGARTIATERVTFPTVLDGIRPPVPPDFRVWFDLPNPRPNGTMWVMVTVYGPDGLPLAGIRRAFVVGPLLEANAAQPAR